MILMLRHAAGAGVQSACVFTGFLGFLFISIPISNWNAVVQGKIVPQ